MSANQAARGQVFANQPAVRTSPWLLVSDVDETLVGDDEALQRFADILAESDGLLLALNSSRPLASLRRTLCLSRVVLSPRAMIGAMGTEMELGGDLVADWSARFGGWDRSPVDALMGRLGFVPHDDEFQTAWKASFHVPRSAWTAVKKALEAARIPALVVTSGGADLDILPPGAGKGTATTCLAERLGVPPARVVVAGDSGNDLPMFAVAGRGIAVGNARAELLDGVQASVYRARAGYAQGVLEGLVHFGVLRLQATTAS